MDKMDRYEQFSLAACRARIAELEACVLEYWNAKDWDAIGAADATAAKLLPADMRSRADCAMDRTDESSSDRSSERR